MKKSTMTAIVLGMVLVLGAFWGYLKFNISQEKNIQTQDNQAVFEPTNERGDEVNGDDKIDEMTEKSEDLKKGNKDDSHEGMVGRKDLGEVSVISPLYELTGETPEGTEKISVTWLNKDTDETMSYDLSKFQKGDKTFFTRMRIDLGNISKGKNEYTVLFYVGEDQAILIEKQTLVINATYKELIYKDLIVYYDDIKEQRLSDTDSRGNLYLQIKSKNDKVKTREGNNEIGQGIIYQYKKKYAVTYDTMILNDREELFLIAKNKALSNEKIGIDYAIVADLYTLENELVGPKIPIIGRSTGGEYATSLYVNPNGSIGLQFKN